MTGIASSQTQQDTISWQNLLTMTHIHIYIGSAFLVVGQSLCSIVDMLMSIADSHDVT